MYIPQQEPQPGQAQSSRQLSAVHGVCGVHSAAGAATGAGAVFQTAELVAGHLASLRRAHRLEHGGERNFMSFINARLHGSARDEHGGDVDARRAHHHAGNDLVAVGYEDDAVERVPYEHGLDAVRDKLAGGQGILHSRVSHGDAVANAYRGYDERRTARGVNTRFDRVRDAVEVHVTGDYVALGGYDRNKRLAEFFVRHSERLIQRTLRRLVYSLRKILAHFALSFLRVAPLFNIFSSKIIHPVRRNRQGIFSG